MTDIHDIKPALAMGPDLGWLVWVLVAVLVLAGGAVAWWLWRRRKKPAASAGMPLLSPETEAFARLDALAADHGINGKQYYFRLSAILRQYVERRYDIPAAEMTMEELLPRMDGLPVPGELRDLFKYFCRAAEPIKFAGTPADQNRKNEDLAFARTFVQSTTPVVTDQRPDENGINK
ncbi:MAG: DUF4381 family protein [Desulfatitalea sp.]|nr:DUF4381 family protein [Desulfatitalea sp.]